MEEKQKERSTTWKKIVIRVIILLAFLLVLWLDYLIISTAVKGIVFIDEYFSEWMSTLRMSKIEESEKIEETKTLTKEEVQRKIKQEEEELEKIIGGQMNNKVNP